MTVTPIRPAANDPGKPTKWLSGDASCAACGHIWGAVAPVGTTSLECPNCERMRGAFMWPVGADDNALVYACYTCHSVGFAFSKAPDAQHPTISCIGCGKVHTVDKVFPV